MVHLRVFFDELKTLSEVRATRTVETLVGGMIGHANRDEGIDDLFLPQCLGFCSCCGRYMGGIGYEVTTYDTGNYDVKHRGEGDVITHVSLTPFYCI